MNTEKMGRIAFWSLLSLLVVLYAFFIFTMKYDAIIFDETRIVGEFMDQYFADTSLLNRLRALFTKENETYPALIRVFYLASFYLTGSVQFKWLGYLADMIPLVLLAFVYLKRATFQLGRLAFLALAFLLLNPYPDHIFNFTYASFFYFISILLPIFIFYYFIHGKQKIALVLLVVLGLCSSVYFVVGGTLILIAVAQKNYRTAGLAIVILVVIAFIPKALFPPVAGSDSMEAIIQGFSHLPELAQLFFITLGSWVQLFNLQSLNQFAFWIGLVGFAAIIYLLTRVYRTQGVSDRWLFFVVLQLYFWLVFASTMVLRWNLNYDYQYNQIFSVYKSFFVFTYLFVTLISLYNFVQTPIMRKSLTYLSLVFVLSFFINYYYDFNVWSSMYKNAMLAEVNYKTRHPSITFGNYTFYKDYRKMKQKGWMSADPTPFDDIDLQQLVDSNQYKVDESIKLQVLAGAAPTAPNMYNISLDPLIMYSMNLDYYVNPLRHQDGLYLYLDSAEDKTIINFRNREINPVKVFLMGQRFNSSWMIASVENSIALELYRTTYDMYLLHIVDGELSEMTKIGNRLKVSGEDAFELIAVNYSTGGR